LFLNFSGSLFLSSPVSTAIKAVKPVVLRSPAVDEFSRECVEFFVEAARLFRSRPSVGEIYGLLYASQFL
jgi:hypothetical protein